MPSYWQAKRCLVTGASAGLGRAIAAALVSRGAYVTLNARGTEPLEASVKFLSEVGVATGGKAALAAADVTDANDVQSLAETVHRQWGGLDLLCNCAGMSMRGAILELRAEDFQQLWDVNFLAAVRVTQAVAPQLLASGGHVVNIGSLGSKIAPAFMGAYPASKFALAAYSQQLRLELGARGLHVLLVCPGPIARDDAPAPAAAHASNAGQGRYADSASAGVPDAAHQPAGGAKLKLIDPDWLAARILSHCQKRKRELVVPGKARLLFAISQLSPSLGDWLLKRSVRS